MIFLFRALITRQRHNGKLNVPSKINNYQTKAKE